MVHVRQRLLNSALLAVLFVFNSGLTGNAGAEESPASKAPEDNPAARAQWNAMFRTDADGRLLSENRLKALTQACELPIDPSMTGGADGLGAGFAGQAKFTPDTFSGTSWQSIGPQPIQSKPYSDRAWGNVAGRVSAIAVHPSNASLILLGSATGGIWKSTDAGQTWRPVSDSAPSLAISSITFAPSNPSIAFATTGELDDWPLETVPSQSLGTYLGGGLLRSVDTGETWTRIDVNLPTSSIMSRVLVDPTNVQNVIVAILFQQDISGDGWFYQGIWLSGDGGVHFARTFAHAVTDLAQDPNDPKRLYFAASNSVCTGCPAGGVYLSTDFGQTWSPLFTTAAATGNIKIGVSRTQPTSIYASFVDDKNRHNASSAGIFGSADAGQSWTRLGFDPSMCPAAPGTNQCGYDHWIRPDPSNPSIVYFGSINLYKSTNAGVNWFKITDNYNSSGNPVPVHPDQHAVAFSPASSAIVYFGNDGGIYKTADAGQTFQNLNSTLALTQFIGVTPHTTDPNTVFGGTQDNGGLRYTGQPLWTDRISGDGGFVKLRRDNPQVVTFAHFYAYLEYSTDGGSTISDVTDCVNLMDCTSSKYREPMAFYPPAASAPSAPSTLFLGTDRIWANNSFGSNSAAWAARSPTSITSTVFTALDVLGDGSSVIWAGSQGGGVWFSANGGATFTRSSGLPTAVVTRVVAVTPDGRNAYATFGGFLGLPSSHIFRTTDAGTTWTNISSNLPDVPLTALAIDPSDPTDIFVGSDVGVFRSVNGGASWVSFNQGLPNVSVSDLVFHPASGDLYAATYGRGMFRIRAPGVVTAPASASFSFSPPSPAAAQLIQFTDTSTNSPASWFWTFGDGTTSTLQNPSKAFATGGSFTVALTVTNALGNSTASQTVAVGGGVGPCVTTAANLCLSSGRFRVRASWQTATGSGSGTAVPLTSDTGYFWFFTGANVEMIVKVLNACPLNGRKWVFAGGLTNVNVVLTVTDTQTGAVRSYTNPQNTAFQPIQDTNAFSTCP